MAGLIYDKSEVSRLQDLLGEQEKQFSEIDKQTELTNKSILRYTLIGAGSIIFLIAFKYLISKRK
jgi:hypothetical protein